MWDHLWIDVNLATMEPGEPGEPGKPGGPYGALEDGALGVAEGAIAWLGPRAELPRPPAACAELVHQGGGGWITPGLIDCHTHLVYAGSRAREFELRLSGASYAEIARAGGGILATVEATRRASEAELTAAAGRRLESLAGEGVTTIEIKSGYGLELAAEARMLRAARALAARHGVEVRTTFLGAHALPPEYAGDADGYIARVTDEMLPAVAAEGLADAVDAFCETIGFTPGQTERVFEAAARLGLPVKLHADQLSDLGGAALAARHRALSADHLEYTSAAGVRALAEAGTVAVLLPGAFYFLRETQAPPVELMRRHGVAMALASDSNPGSSPAGSLLLMLSMGCTFFRLTPEEALAGVTRHAARALGLAHSHGTLAVGKVADLALWDIGHPSELAYHFGANPCRTVVKGGRVTRGAA